MKRSYVGLTTNEIELLFFGAAKVNDQKIIKKISHELSFRKRNKAITLKDDVDNFLLGADSNDKGFSSSYLKKLGL